jgi:ferric-dicitrate binding protein FerR (iron transport regulator)
VSWQIAPDQLLPFVEGDCTPAEAAAVQRWIAADPRRRELLDELRTVWRLTGRALRRWARAEAQLRLPRIRGRHAGRRSGGSSARPRRR